MLFERKNLSHFHDFSVWVIKTLPICGVGGAHGHNRRAPHDLIEGGFGVGQFALVFHLRKVVDANHRVQFGLDFAEDFRVTQHVDHRPEEGGLEGLHAGREQVKDYLLKLLHRLPGLEQPLVHFRVFVVHLDQVVLNQVSGIGVGHVKLFNVLVDYL